MKKTKKLTQKDIKACEEGRKCCNKFTKAEREYYLSLGMKLIKKNKRIL